MEKKPIRRVRVWLFSLLPALYDMDDGEMYMNNWFTRSGWFGGNWITSFLSFIFSTLLEMKGKEPAFVFHVPMESRKMIGVYERFKNDKIVMKELDKLFIKKYGFHRTENKEQL